MVTGYYEPLLRGSRTRAKGYEQPVRGVPDDLLTIDLSSVFPELKDKRVRGRLEGNKIVPYWSRADIVAHGEKLPGKTLLFVDDAVELFFLQVQGSGRVKLTDGSTARLNYADQNGHPYQSIGKALVDRGELRLEEASMQGIQAWARANPTRLDSLLNANPSYVFFREVPNSQDGPIGALGVPLTAERSIAIDPRSIPLGSPVFLATTRPNTALPMNRLVMAQDTGGAIKGAVRADFFWGFGKEAGEQAGRMKQSGRLWVLLPSELAPK
jgi:membrane-bound lytic murein transglycosylase A